MGELGCGVGRAGVAMSGCPRFFLDLVGKLFDEVRQRAARAPLAPLKPRNRRLLDEQPLAQLSLADAEAVAEGFDIGTHTADNTAGIEPRQ